MEESTYPVRLIFSIRPWQSLGRKGNRNISINLRHVQILTTIRSSQTLEVMTVKLNDFRRHPCPEFLSNGETVLMIVI